MVFTWNSRQCCFLIFQMFPASLKAVTDTIKSQEKVWLPWGRRLRVWGWIPVTGASPALLTQEGQGVAPSVWRKAAASWMAGGAVRHQKLPSNLPVFPEASVPLNCACRVPFVGSSHGERWGPSTEVTPFSSLLLLQGKHVIRFWQTLTWFCTWAGGHSFLSSCTRSSWGQRERGGWSVVHGGGGCTLPCYQSPFLILLPTLSTPSHCGVVLEHTPCLTI